MVTLQLNPSLYSQILWPSFLGLNAHPVEKRFVDGKKLGTNTLDLIMLIHFFGGIMNYYKWRFPRFRFGIRPHSTYNVQNLTYFMGSSLLKLNSQHVVNKTNILHRIGDLEFSLIFEGYYVIKKWNQVEKKKEKIWLIIFKFI